ncbi:MAG: SPOR domain-containing protein [Phycisphaerae bacterium]
MVRAFAILFLIVVTAANALADGAADADAGSARLEAKDPHTAIDLFTRAIQSKQLSQEKLALTYHRRGMAFYMQGEAGRAILDYTIALWHDDLPREFRYRTLNNRGLAFEVLNKQEAALKDYGLSIRLNPNSAEAYANRGNLRRKFNQNAEAVQDYDMALRSGHSRPQYVFLWQGMALEALGKRREAADALRRALQIDGNFEEARTQLARLDQNRALTGLVGRKALLNGKGGPLIVPGQTGFGPGEFAGAPWTPSVPKTPSIVQGPAAGSETGAPGVGLRGGLVDTAAARVPAAVPAASAAPAPASRPQYYLQLGSYETQAKAEAGWTRISVAGRGLLDGIGREVVRVELVGRGTVYRLLGAALAERDEAQRRCQALEDRGVVCVVVRR